MIFCCEKRAPGAALARLSCARLTLERPGARARTQLAAAEGECGRGVAETVDATGAVYRLITNFVDPDSSLVTIGPGISWQPGSPFYGNLLDRWACGEFSRSRSRARRSRR
jgi:hypothetical protein